MNEPSGPSGSAGARHHPPTLVSVIIPVRDGADTLPAQLDALAGQTYDGAWEVVVADNGSNDGSASVVARWADRLPGLAVVDAAERAGSAHARNRAVAAAGGELLCFCDADDVVADTWLAALVAAAAHTDVVAGVLELDELNDPVARSWRPTPLTAAEDAPANFAPSGNMAVWRHAFEAVGGFDEDYPKSHDVELGARLRAAGYRITRAPGAVVHYRLRATLGGLARQAYRAGRATVQLRADHAGGMAPPPPRAELHRWWWVATRVPFLAVPDRRGIWVRQTAEGAGVAAGRLRRATTGFGAGRRR